MGVVDRIRGPRGLELDIMGGFQAQREKRICVCSALICLGAYKFYPFMKKNHSEIGLPDKIIYKRESPKDWKISKVDESFLDEWLNSKLKKE
jgi:hypothetical protein